MSWVLLVLAGVIEVAWSQSIKPTEGFTRPLPTALCFALAAAAVYLLSLAMQRIPVGTAYVVFTGIGAVGAVAIGILVHHEPATTSRLVALGLIVGGIALAKATATA
ncbi:hypothetical protein BJF85_03335 [Saccharomonospora sp. CUA-673]|uniref:DMT family transporter n=1 Tax=Saccharomonospora sp. CUA-673 TaxID=1904969 RepID=UPI000968AE4B|nr:multidrug efflux SMR transporter [Saccharomonospora sp. CUA-673]OLT43111.1 hypothetical protein BJF85_03335 [Saccharomonospora sp. CUA-673]